MTAWKRELGFHRNVPASDPAPLARGYRQKWYQPSLFWPLTCCPHPCAHREPVPPRVQPFVGETGPALPQAQLLHCSPGDSCQEDPSLQPVRMGPLCLNCIMCALGRTKSFHYSMTYGAKCSGGSGSFPHRDNSASASASASWGVFNQCNLGQELSILANQKALEMDDEHVTLLMMILFL